MAHKGSCCGIQFIAGCRLFQATQTERSQSGKQFQTILMLSGNTPQILRSTWVTFYGVIAHDLKLLHEPKPTVGEHAHGAERDGEEADASVLEFTVAVTKMFT